MTSKEALKQDIIKRFGFDPSKIGIHHLNWRLITLDDYDSLLVPHAGVTEGDLCVETLDCDQYDIAALRLPNYVGMTRQFVNDDRGECICYFFKPIEEGIVCKYCQSGEQFSENEQSKRTCAFETGIFSPRNWNCGTMNCLRYYINIGHVIKLQSNDDGGFPIETWYCRDDNAAGTCGVICIPENDIVNGYLVMGWYKSRNRIDSATIINDGEPHPLRLYEAYAIIDALRGSVSI
jgi:hypothetical protein